MILVAQRRLELMSLLLAWAGHVQAGEILLPPGFAAEPFSASLFAPVALAFADDGRLFVAEQRGTVQVFVDGEQQPQPFIDLRGEVAGAGYRGLLGLALDPDFLTNRRVYLAYTVDPIAGEPDEPDDVPTFSRLTRYTGTLASGGNVADPASRHILIGAIPSEGIPVCWAHTIDALQFGPDGMLFVGSGDGGHYEFADAGGNDPQCFQPPLFGQDQNLGAFRAQSLNSMAGKILRLDPATGGGLPSNPYWNGIPTSPRARVWVSGLRNPFRYCVKPGSTGPGTLYIGDVGWDTFEEINIAKIGGENFGWPCYEGPQPAPVYPNLNPPSSGCATIQTPSNPGPLTAPLLHWHHSDPTQSFPTGFVGVNSIGGAFYTGASYPPAYHGGLFYADYYWGWINVLKIDSSDALQNVFPFASRVSGLVDLAPDPITGELHYVSVFAEQIYRITYNGPCAGDINGDFVVNVNDLLEVVGHWGPCPGGPPVCPADVNGDGTVNVNDLLAVIGVWGPCS